MAAFLLLVMICSDCRNFRLIKLGTDIGYCLYHRREVRAKDASCGQFA